MIQWAALGVRCSCRLHGRVWVMAGGTEQQLMGCDKASFARRAYRLQYCKGLGVGNRAYGELCLCGGLVGGAGQSGLQ